jgi:hypothetical protein
MSEILTFGPYDVAPEADAVFEHQGIPNGEAVPARIKRLLDNAVAAFARSATPKGLLKAVTRAEFGDIFRGEGRNEPRTPVGDIYEAADHLALFVVTIGSDISEEIDACFKSGDPALGCMLDSVASAAADRTADRVEGVFTYRLEVAGRLLPKSAVLRYSPGYCGWHISGQRKLFEFLRPDRIGVSLRESLLMEPLKSISGVIIAGRRQIHEFPNTYPFCDQCEDQGCRARIRALYAC